MAAAYWNPIFAWLSEDPDIAAWLTDAEQQVIRDAQEGELPIWRALFQFQGFDAKRIIRNMVLRSREYMANQPRAEVEFAYMVEGNRRTYKYSNLETMAKDVEMIVFLFAERGNAVNKITAKSLPVVGQIIEWLTNKYALDVQPHAPGTALDPDVVSISRVVSCFPTKICEYYHRGYGNALYSFNDIGIEPTEDLSRSLLCPHLIAMIPLTFVQPNPQVHFVLFAGHLQVDRVIHRKTRQYSTMRELFTYYAAEYRTPVTSQASREAFVRAMALVSGADSRPINVIRNAITRAADIIHDIAGNDPNFDLVMDELQHLI